MLPPLRDGERVSLLAPKVEAKETKPPLRYNEGTLIDAMANAWRFVQNPEHRERLKEAKGIGTPATRGEIIQGLKRQEMLIASGKHIVPTERGLALFGVLETSDPALVDPAVTAKLEFLLDEVLFGRRCAQDAIDAVSGQAARIISRLLAAPPAACRPLPALSSPSGPVSPATSDKQRRPLRRVRAVSGSSRPAAPGALTPLTKPKARPSRAGRQAGRAELPDTSRAGSGGDAIALKIPFGNKELALRLGARYRSGGWFAAPGTNLEPFREKGWL